MRMYVEKMLNVILALESKKILKEKYIKARVDLL